MTTRTKPAASRTRAGLLLGALAAVLAVGGPAALPASASDPDAGARAGGAGARPVVAEHATGVDTPAEALAVERHHTKARRATAADAAALLRASGQAGAAGSAASARAERRTPTGLPGSLPAAGPSAAVVREWVKDMPKGAAQEVRKAFAGELAANQPLIRTVGKVEYTDPRDKLTYQCSGAAINSPSKMMVATAGHCIGVGGSSPSGDPNKRRWMENWVFTPAYNTGGVEAPYGKFTAKHYSALDYWMSGAARPYDFGLVTTNPNAQGQRVVDAVGGFGLAWNYTFEEDRLIVGYPRSHDEGYSQYQFAGRTTTSIKESAMIMMPGAGFDYGGSGGPWLRNYDPVTGKASINGVTSYIHNGSSNNNDSPHFDGGMKWLWDQEGSRT
ncbi:trypsin-like serine peptidase [Streptomyces sp. NPDC050504]|uniref:trypsin-like serine peptidase n=1 Tax=Streptomyces sp. NPDC050504 TaxID=3365618 RepID=UPI0037A5AFB9